MGGGCVLNRDADDMAGRLLQTWHQTEGGERNITDWKRGGKFGGISRRGDPLDCAVEIMLVTVNVWPVC